MSSEKSSTFDFVSDFDTYTDYLLSQNICLITQSLGIKKIGANALVLLTNIISSHIDSIVMKTKDYTELSGRYETNLIDVLFSLLNNCNNNQSISQDILEKYISCSKLKNVPKLHINKQYLKEEYTTNNLIKRINSANVEAKYTTSIPKNLINSIPKCLRYFPREFALKYSEIEINNNDLEKQKRKAIKNIEKKSLEDIISSNNYYSLTKKRARQENSIDIIAIFSELLKGDGNNSSANPINVGGPSGEGSGNNLRFGKRFKMKIEDEYVKNNNLNGINNNLVGGNNIENGGD